MSDLKNAVKAVAESKTAEEKLKALSQAYLLFTEETSRLRNAYEGLQKQFILVREELEESNLQLHGKVVEYGLITEYLDTILINISQGIVFIDLKGVITTFNPGAERILGIRSPIVLFDLFWDNFDDHIFGFSIREALNSRQAPKNLTIPIEVPGQDKKIVEIETTFVDESGGASSPVAPMQGLIILMRDITEIRGLQLLAQRNDRLKELGEMAASVAHEIRNPLGGIKGFASLLYRDLAERPDLQKMAKLIIDGTDAMDRLVTQVLQYARPMEVKPTPTDVKTLLKDLTDHLRVDEKVNQLIQIDLDTSGVETLWNIDPDMFRSVILNLLVNSVQAMPKGGTIKVKAWKEGQLGCLEVSDNGIGIKEEHLEKIFSPFFTTRPDGTGFGLSEAYKIIQAHNGTIDVISTLGSGTTFIIRIPIK